MRRVVRANEKIGTNPGKFLGRTNQLVGNSVPVVGAHAFDVVDEGQSIHRDFWMVVRTHELRSFTANGPVTKRCPFGTTGHNTNMLDAHFLMVSGPIITINGEGNRLPALSPAAGHFGSAGTSLFNTSRLRE